MGNDFLSARINEKQAAKIALDLYGLKGIMTSLPGEIDFNFHIKSDTGAYLLKISRPEFNVEQIEYQLRLLEHVAASSEQLETPIPVPDQHGNQLSEVTDDSGRKRKVRLLTWIEGRLWSGVHPINESLLFSLGAQAGKLTKVLQDFDHPMAHREFEWDVSQAQWTYDALHQFSPEQQSIVGFFQNNYRSFQDEYQQMRKGVVHNDANDNNVIVSTDLVDPVVTSIIDFGDAVHTQIINDLAITIAYAVMGKPDALRAALQVVKGYHSQFPMLEKELEFLYYLVAMRLVISVAKSALNKQAEPDNNYLLISEEPAWNLLKKWRNVNEEFALCSFRNACGYSPHPKESDFRHWAGKNQVKLADLFPTLQKDEAFYLDLGVSSTWIGHQSELDDLDLFQFKIERLQAQVPNKIIAGGYLEPRSAYTSSAYDKQGNHGKESRTIHLGIDLWVPPGTPVHALFDGEVVAAVNDSGDKEYGGLVILKHRADPFEFFTLHGHLSLESLDRLQKGQLLTRHDQVGTIGNYPENGNWAPHLHFQVMLSTLGFTDDFPGVTYAKEIEVWKGICPDPNLVLNLPDLQPHPTKDLDEIIAYRKMHLGRSLSLSYKEPLKIVRGYGSFLIDTSGRKYLDTVNNVGHVGHEHPAVVKAGQQQMAVLNTNTRYLHDNLTVFVKKLLATFPDQLSVVHVVNSGSEANELALRMARAVTRQKDMIAIEVGYHGNTSGCVDVSSYKFDGKGGAGAPDHTHIVPLPDRFRGIYQGNDTGKPYADHVQRQIEHIQSLGRGLAGFIGESIISCGGQIELPDGYLRLVYESVRAAGGVCIADEVQVGCGRLGSAFWGFQLHDVIPDIVTIGKPIGNGHPLAAVVCTSEVAEAFANGMEYFNTFGGNPVSCAIGTAVLRVINDEKLQEHALAVGNYLKSSLQEIKADFPFVGDIRGQGLFLGVELADASKKPLTDKASYLVNRMNEQGILMSTDGRDNNVLKIKPPMVFSKENADELLSALRTVFKDDFMQQ